MTYLDGCWSEGLAATGGRRYKAGWRWVAPPSGHLWFCGAPAGATKLRPPHLLEGGGAEELANKDERGAALGGIGRHWEALGGVGRRTSQPTLLDMRLFLHLLLLLLRFENRLNVSEIYRLKK